jgi:predicted alpha-1,2-mannosidase
VRPFNPTGATDGFSEASAAQYQWLVPQDPAGLFKLLGGEQAALTRLDGFFDYPGLLMDQDATTHTVWCPPPNGMCPSAHYNPNNEPDLHAPFLYLWTRQPYKTATVVRAAQDLYHTGPDGLPGNDDLGTMSAWYVFASLGIYPVLPGSGAYELTSPLFPHAVVRLPGPYYHGELVIDAPGASDARRYITAASLDGRSFDRDWIGQATVTAGATIHYDVADRQPGDDATTWGGAPQARPPELLTGDAGPSR